MLRLPATLLACALVAFAAGCGGSGGVSSGATVSVYVGASLCPGAQRELTSSGGRAGDVEVRALCLAAAERGGRLDLAVVGANARRASEDSTAIAYVESAGPANRFARTIVEQSGIAWTTGASGAIATRRILDAVSAAGSGSLRDEVREALEAS